jgi:hypothetical protein
MKNFIAGLTICVQIASGTVFGQTENKLPTGLLAVLNDPANVNPVISPDTTSPFLSHE